MARVNNLAYDLSVYEQLPQKQPEKRIQVRKNSPQPSVSVFKSVLLAVASLFLLCAIINGKVETSKLYRESAVVDKQLANITSENARLETEYQGKTSIQAVENYAETKLGLVKLDESQREYIKIQKENVIEVVKNNDTNIFVSVKNWFTDVLEYIGA